MRPVQLLPSSKSKATTASSSQTQLIALGMVAALAVVGWFGYAKVSDIKTQATLVQMSATQLNNEATSLDAQIQEAGQKTDWGTRASDAEQLVVQGLSERVDFAKLVGDLSSVVPDGAWLERISAEAEGEGAAIPVNIDAYAPDMETVAALVTRLNAMPNMQHARVRSSAWVPAGKKKVAQTTIVAMLTPDATGSSAASDLVSAGGGTSLVLEPVPGFDREGSLDKKVAKGKKKAKKSGDSGTSNPMSPLAKTAKETQQAKAAS